MEIQRAEFADVFDRYRERVFHWAMRYAGGDRAWAEDLTHDVFLRLHGQLGRLDPGRDVAPWLHTVTARLAMTRRRDEHSFAARLAMFFKPQATAALDEQVEARRAATDALAMLRVLPERERVVLCMQLLDGMKQRDIAQALELSAGQVSKLLKRGRERIRVAGWRLAPAEEHS